MTLRAKQACDPSHWSVNHGVIIADYRVVLLRDPQARRSVAAMTETERKLNAELLREVEAAASGGTIPALRSP